MSGDILVPDHDATPEAIDEFVAARGGNPGCGACAEVAFTGVTLARHDCGETAGVVVEYPDVGCSDGCGAAEDAHCWNNSEWADEGGAR